MRKIVAGMFMSLDGVVEAPEKWNMPYFNAEMGAEIGGQMAASDTMLLGRRTYQEFTGFFAPQTGNPTADQMNAMPKVVVSTTLDTADWQNSTLIRGNVAEEITRLKEQPGKDITISGSATLVRSLLRDGLLDELQLFVHPLVVGSGKRLFEDAGVQFALTLADSKTYSNGVLFLTYTPANG